MTVSIGGEIGEVGKKQLDRGRSCDAFMTAYMTELRPEAAARPGGLSKISVQTGTSHGGVVLPDGTIADVAVDFETLARLSAVARTTTGWGVRSSTAPRRCRRGLPPVPRARRSRVHLATEFQNIALRSRRLPRPTQARDVRRTAWTSCRRGAKGDTEEQFIYKTRKKMLGPYKRRSGSCPRRARSSPPRRPRSDTSWSSSLSRARLGMWRPTCPRHTIGGPCQRR